MPITIRLAETDEDQQRVFHFRYDIYVAEMGREQKYADHEARTICEPFDTTGHIFMAEEDGAVVGTVRTNFGRDTDLGYYADLYGMTCVGRHYPEYVSVTTKFMVAANLRKGTLAYRLATVGYQYNLKNHIHFDFIDCNPHLEETFERLGHRRYRDRIQHHEYGDVLPLVLPLTDLDHLESVGSPWAKICREHFPHLEANRILRQAVQSYQHQQQQTIAA